MVRVRKMLQYIPIYANIFYIGFGYIIGPMSKLTVRALHPHETIINILDDLLSKRTGCVAPNVG
jgi:hypothetical protein